MLSRFFGTLLIFLILTLSIQAIIFTFSYIALINNTVIDIAGIRAIQKDIYEDNHRQIWQSKKECVKYDEELIYVPLIGSCNFNNPEFSTTLNFYEFGRQNKNYLESENKGVAVLGDSYAMGWGVNDQETFSSLLQEKLKRNFYNLSVSSYSTYRELLRLDKLNLMNSIDTIIIQYSPNDLNENLTYEFLNKTTSKEMFEIVTNDKKINLNEKIKFIIKKFSLSFRLLFFDIRDSLFGKKLVTKDFNKHYSALISIFNKFDFMREKKIIFFYIDKELSFYNYPEGFDKEYSNINFINLSLTDEDFFIIDMHINKLGHQKIALQLETYLK